jgi:hypothetical protein
MTCDLFSCQREEQCDECYAEDEAKESVIREEQDNAYSHNKIDYEFSRDTD